jgi:hypothetical protein
MIAIRHHFLVKVKYLMKISTIVKDTRLKNYLVHGRNYEKIL